MSVRPRAPTSDRVSILTHFTFTAWDAFWTSSALLSNQHRSPHLHPYTQPLYSAPIVSSLLASSYTLYLRQKDSERPIVQGAGCQQKSIRMTPTQKKNSHEAILDEEKVFKCNHCNWDCQSCIGLYRHCTTNTSWIKTSQAHFCVLLTLSMLLLIFSYNLQTFLYLDYS